MAKMNFNDYGRAMAKYNSWQNGVLYDLCDQIGDEERRRDRGMFFGSIHATLNHLLYIDHRILGILKTGQAEPFDARTFMADDFETLGKMRIETDAAIAEFVDSSDHGWQDDFRELMGLDGVTRKLPRQLFLMQLFNHQTHHRSQITSELYKMGLDYGITDVPLTPDLPL
ncbi:DinB family protein [Thalassospira xiamenensis]|uniref:MFS transporter, DHA1 family, bicyclomycin/chloramphenicol resistance protein n=1 Tax=Thalassospira xiamenensis TaxID=220697 RepID=A0A285RP52_9PROT|nr:DinB family protein [Thalassospira xiamenensis]SOB94107.1 MFS transporter, DHA1 family, bicyclomycin/chloramphenicol resistance protein [Thalassospira xiamenensis]